MSHADCSAVQTVARWLVTSQNIRDFAQSRRGLSKRNETPRIVIKMNFLHRPTYLKFGVSTEKFLVKIGVFTVVTTDSATVQFSESVHGRPAVHGLVSSSE